MPTVSDILAITLKIDTSGLERGQQDAQAALSHTKRTLEQQGNDLERVAKNLGYGMETLVKGVAQFFGLVLSFEGFKKLVTDAAAAGSSMGRFAESIDSTVERTQLYGQAFRAIAGNDTGILQTLQKMKTELTAVQQGFPRTDWMNRLEQLTGKSLTRMEPEQILQESSRALQQRGISPAQARQYFPGLPLSEGDVVALTKQRALLEELEKQRTQIGTPTTPQAKAMERLQADISNVRTASELLALQTATLVEPFLHELLTLTQRVLSWLRGVAQATGLHVADVPAPSTQRIEETPGGAAMVGPRTGVRRPGAATQAPSRPATQAPSAPLVPPAPTTVPSAPSTSVPSVPRQQSQVPGKQSAVTLHRSGAPADAVDDALRLEGLHERRDRATIIEYLRTGGAGMDPATTSWCAAFVNASLQREGIRGSGSAVATSFLRWGVPVTGQIQKGDVLVESRGRHAGETGGHVGMATGRTHMGPSGLEYEIVAGNTKDSVRRYWISAHSVTPRRALPNVSTGPAAAVQSSEAMRPRVENNATTANINRVIVNTQATDAAGIAKDVRDHIGRELSLVPGD